MSPHPRSDPTPGSARTLSFVEVPGDLPTPALVIDAAIAERNLRQMADYVGRHHLRLRPHTKTHKSQVLARRQVEAGAKGLTAAKVGEAETMAEVDDDILLAYPAVDPARCSRLAELARSRCVRVAVDTAAAVAALSAAAAAARTQIGLLVDLDVGMKRTGVATAADSLRLAQLVAGSAGVRLDGLFCYPGHIRAAAEAQAPFLADVSAKLEEALSLWAGHGLEAKIVSGGSTPTALRSHLVKAYTEIRPGTYIFNDLNTLRGGYCALEDCAARLVFTVVSDAVKDQVIIDGGSKTLTSDLCLPAPQSGHGYIVEYPQARIGRMSEEHGMVDVSLCERRPRVGERVTVVPNHICPCVNLQDAYWWLEPKQAPRRIAVDARGRLS